MKVLLLQDVYKLGRAGDVKKVADGYGRNYLIPKKLAILATPGALRGAEHIRAKAAAQRSVLNQELSGVAEQLSQCVLYFPMRASETEKLYGSVNSKMIADAIHEKLGVEINRHQVDQQPIRTLGVFKVPVRLTIDLVPTVTVIVHREGQAPMLEVEAKSVAQTEAEGVEVAGEAEPDQE